jgi:hypothetical protein
MTAIRHWRSYRLSARVTLRAAAVLAACAVLAPAAQAQRYRVLVGEEGSSRVSLVEFRPCVPAETSDCGAWLVQTLDAASDSAARPGHGAERVVSQRAGAAIAIQGSSVVITPMASDERPVTVSGTHGRPLALAVSGDGAYVFGIFDRIADHPPELEMIDMNTRTVWAIFPLKTRPAGISMAAP